jgi:hypothetical protein
MIFVENFMQKGSKAGVHKFSILPESTSKFQAPEV